MFLHSAHLIDTQHYQQTGEIARAIIHKKCAANCAECADEEGGNGFVSEEKPFSPSKVWNGSQVVLIRGKGIKERKIYLASTPVVRALKEYLQVRAPRVTDEPFFFLNRDGNRLSEQPVRRIINRYTELSNQPGHYTPHMFCHSFATYLWDACGDVYEVKEILCHSSIKTTERYVHASLERPKKVLSTMHPRETLIFKR